MDWLDENVAIGGWLDALRFNLLERERVDVLIDVRPLYDRRPNVLGRKPKVEALLRFADSLVDISRRNVRVMIRCREGKDRTPLVAAAYLSKRQGMTLREAYEPVRSRHPRTRFHWAGSTCSRRLADLLPFHSEVVAVISSMTSPLRSPADARSRGSSRCGCSRSSARRGRSASGRTGSAPQRRR